MPQALRYATLASGVSPSRGASRVGWVSGLERTGVKWRETMPRITQPQL
ncbi:hypothetical protein [uncultured Nostoc sp.]|nr:hypothetical protein [uncultured Nostoc sp.]